MPQPPPLRVLHLISSLHVGGAGRLMLRNLTLLEARGVENHVCYLTTRSDLRERFAEAGFPPICLEHRSRGDALRTLRSLIRLVRRLRIDVIHTNLELDGSYGRLAGWWCGLPVVTTLHDADSPPALAWEGGWPVIRGKKLFVDLLARLLTTRFVAVSGAVRAHYIANHWVAEGRVDVVYPPLDHDALQRQTDPDAVESVRASLSLGPSHPVVLNVARLHPIKDQLSLVRSMPHLLRRWPSARLLIAGDGEMRPELEQLIESEGLQGSVTLLGQRSDVPTLLAASDVFVLSSLSEGLPGSVLEAMSAGKAVVATRVGGIPEVVEDGVNGHLVEPSNPSALADAIGQLAADLERAKAMGLAGQRIVTGRFEPSASASRLVRVYSAVAKGRGAAPSPLRGGSAERTPKSAVLHSLRFMQGSRVARRLNRQHIRILTYHGFTDAPPDSPGRSFDTHIDAFRMQLRHLRRHYNIVPLGAALDHITEGKPLPSNAAVITIDDAYRSAFDLAFPALQEVDAQASVFPAIDFVDGKGLMWTDRVKACAIACPTATVVEVPTRPGGVEVELGGPNPRSGARRVVNVLLGLEAEERETALRALEEQVGEGLLSVTLDAFRAMGWIDLAQMVASGLVTVGSHTRSHPMVTRLSDHDLEGELVESKRILESRLGIRCDLFCYPYGGVGAFDDRVAGFVRAAGYRCALTTIPGMVLAGSDPFKLQRLGAAEDVLTFDFAMSGLSSLLSSSKQAVTRRMPRPRSASPGETAAGTLSRPRTT